MSERRCLVTGGAGFIGSHLAEALLARGDSVTVVDDLSTGSWANIDHLAADERFRAIVASAGEADLLDREVPAHDVVYHLASAVGVKLIIDQPVQTIETIVNVTDAVFRACSRYRRPVVLTSTSEVYGKSEQLPFREDDDVVMGPTSKRRWAYACAKALDEFLALAHYYESRLPVYVVRLFNTVGPRQSDQYGMVLPTFVRQALRGEPVTVYGDGTQTRCFCAVSDVVRGLIAIPEHPEVAGTVINLGSQEEVAIKDLAARIIELCGSSSEIKYVPYSEAYGPGFDDMRRRVPDTRRALERLGWEPQRSLEEIVLEVAASLR